ncbi:hypothetical protein ACFL7D_03080 [candidate division KSB1 bacterium]
MSQDQKFKKRSYFIQKEFQTKMIVQFILLLVVMAFISSVSLYFLADSELESSYFAAHSTIESMRSALLPAILITNFISVLIIAVVTGYFVLLSSHKIAGPLYKVEKVIKEIAAGNLSIDAKLRKDDQLKNLADSLDNMLKELSGKLQNIKSISSDMSKIDNEIQGIKGKKDFSEADIDKIHQQLKDDKAKLDAELEKFKLQ